VTGAAARLAAGEVYLFCLYVLDREVDRDARIIS